MKNKFSNITETIRRLVEQMKKEVDVGDFNIHFKLQDFIVDIMMGKYGKTGTN